MTVSKKTVRMATSESERWNLVVVVVNSFIKKTSYITVVGLNYVQYKKITIKQMPSYNCV